MAIQMSNKLTSLRMLALVMGLTAGMATGSAQAAKSAFEPGQTSEPSIDWQQTPWSDIAPVAVSNQAAQPLKLAQVGKKLVKKEKLNKSIKLKPKVKDCAPFRATIDCAPFDGVYQLRLRLKGDEAFIAEDFRFSSDDESIHVSQPWPSYPLRLVVDGAEPGDLINIKVDGFIEEGGAAAGTDLCCAGSMSFRIPKALNCGVVLGDVMPDADPEPQPDPAPVPQPVPEPEPNVPEADPVPPAPQLPEKGQWRLRKSQIGDCLTSRERQSYVCDYQLRLTNDGTRRYVGPAVITDRFDPANVIGFELRKGRGWKCSEAIGGAATCVTDQVSLAPGASTTISVRLILPALRRGGLLENCAIPAVGPSRSEKVRVAQQMMEAFGIASGGVDGRMGPNTRRGLKRLQSQIGLPQTGELDDLFFAMLGLSLHDEVSQSCVDTDLPRIRPPVVEEPPVYDPPIVDRPYCDANSTVRRGDRCICRYPGMNKVSPSHCACPRGTLFKKGVGCYAIDPPFGCDLNTTVQRGKGCFCRYRGMERLSATKCGCPSGERLVPGSGCVPIVRPVRCDPDTTVQRGKACLCKYRGMERTSALSCKCPAGTKLVKGRGCRSIVIDPIPPKCDATTLRKGLRCVCRFPNMTKVSATSCACRQGSVFVAGRGCLSVKPIPPKVPQCNLNRTVIKGNKCVCRYSNMRKTSATNCGCTNGRKFIRGQGCVGVIKPNPTLKCSATTKKQGDRCVCRYGNMQQVGPRRCVCRAGFDFVRGKGCIPKNIILPGNTNNGPRFELKIDGKPVIQIRP